MKEIREIFTSHTLAILFLWVISVGIVVSTNASGVGIVIYLQDWENGIGGWFSKHGPSDPVTLVQDSEAPSPTTVQRITYVDLGGNYYSPLIPVTSGETYVVAGWIKWVSGGWPFIGIDQYTYSKDPRWENWLIGMEGYDTGFGETVTPVPIVNGWHWYWKTITIPKGTAYIRIKDELWGGAGRGGRPLGYFDDIALFKFSILTAIDTDLDTLYLISKDRICYLPY